MPHLEQLRQHALTNNVTLSYTNCSAEDSTLCEGINGYPSLVAYRVTKGSVECGSDDMVTSVSYHGPFIASHLIEWYNDIADENIHYAEPHNFHSGIVCSTVY